MTKDDLMQMAREAGGAPLVEGTNTLLFSPIDVERFANAILERAAVECESTPDWVETRGYEQASKIRALKIPEGE